MTFDGSGIKISLDNTASELYPLCWQYVYILAQVDPYDILEEVNEYNSYNAAEGDSGNNVAAYAVLLDCNNVNECELGYHDCDSVLSVCVDLDVDLYTTEKRGYECQCHEGYKLSEDSKECISKLSLPFVLDIIIITFISFYSAYIYGVLCALQVYRHSKINTDMIISPFSIEN